MVEEALKQIQHAELRAADVVTAAKDKAAEILERAQLQALEIDASSKNTAAQLHAEKKKAALAQAEVYRTQVQKRTQAKNAELIQMAKERQKDVEACIKDMLV